MGSDNKIYINAPAKVNFYLRILGRRRDGYHDIETLMQKLDLTDAIELQLQDRGISLESSDNSLPPGSDNLAYKAAQAFLDAYTVQTGVSIKLGKRIPVAAGLGGGSSDAAAVLNGMNILLGKPLDEEHLLEIARPLGADVPFFVSSMSSAWASGIGDCLEKAEVFWQGPIVLVNPGFPVSTKWVYQNFALTRQGNPYMLGREKIDAKKSTLSARDVEKIVFNDLETVTLKEFPEIKRIKDKMLAMGAAGSLMSGSGPTVFGLFEAESSAMQCVQEFSKKYGDNVFLCRPYRCDDHAGASSSGKDTGL